VLFCFLRFPKVPRCSPSWDRIIENDRHPPSPRIRILKEIRAEIKPYPAREPAPPLKHYEPPREREKSALDTCAEGRLGAIRAASAAKPEGPLRVDCRGWRGAG
jgi:hypothetical protein